MATEAITEIYDFDEVTQTARFTFTDGRVIDVDRDTPRSDLLAVHRQLLRGNHADGYREVVSAHLRETRTEREVSDIARDVAMCSHDVIYESPLYRHVRELIDTHPTTLRRERNREASRAMIAQLDQGETWTNVRGETVSISDVDVRYARNILNVVLRNKTRYALAILAEETDAMARGWDGAHSRDLSDDWLDRTALVRALRARIDAASRGEHLLADARQAARRVRHRVTGSWD